MKKWTGINGIRNVIFYVISIFIVSCQHINVQQNEADKIVIFLQLSAKLAHPDPANYVLKDNMDIAYLQITNTEKSAEWQSVNTTVYNGNIKWTFYCSEPVKLKYGFGMLPIVSPGDSIFISYNGEDYIYSGKGAEKLICWNRMRKAGKQLTQPTASNNLIRGMDDYLQWKAYLDNKLLMQMPLLESYRNKITPFEYDYLKAIAVSSVEDDRIQTFGALKAYSKKDSLSGITLSDLNAIWDSTQYHPLSVWLHNQSDYYGDLYNIDEFNKVEVLRQFGFDLNKDSLSSKALRNYLYYTHAKKKYKGLLRERLLAGILGEQTIREVGLKNPLTEVMLKDYYSQPGFPEYKQWVKGIEEKAAKKQAKS